MTDYQPTPLMIAWESALRDPNRLQTKNTLGRKNSDGTVSNCCLGVVEEVAGNVGVEFQHYSGQQYLRYEGPTATGESDLPSRQLIQELMGEGDPSFTGFPGGRNVCLGFAGSTAIFASEANDDYGWSFERIADQLRTVYIEGSGDPKEYQIPDIYSDSEDWDDYEGCECCD